jgi:hypothetical protein
MGISIYLVIKLVFYDVVIAFPNQSLRWSVRVATFNWVTFSRDLKVLEMLIYFTAVEIFYGSVV